MKTFREYYVDPVEFPDLAELDTWLRSELREKESSKMLEDLHQQCCDECLRREMKKANKLLDGQRVRFSGSILVS